jgi:hypothetical protein
MHGRNAKQLKIGDDRSVGSGNVADGDGFMHAEDSGAEKRASLYARRQSRSKRGFALDQAFGNPLHLIPKAAGFTDNAAPSPDPL